MASPSSVWPGQLCPLRYGQRMPSIPLPLIGELVLLRADVNSPPFLALNSAFPTIPSVSSRFIIIIDSRFFGPFIPKGYVDPPYTTAFKKKKPAPALGRRHNMRSSALSARCAQSPGYESP